MGVSVQHTDTPSSKCHLFNPPAPSAPLAASTSPPPQSPPPPSPPAQQHHAHEDHYDPPTGWLFGVKPGEKAEKEGWEAIWVYGFFGSLAAGVVAYAFKPDTSIQTWALEEARRRLEVEGILKEPESKS